MAEDPSSESIRQAAADSEAEALGYEIQIAEEQLALVTFQLEETRALADSLRSQAAAQTKQLEGREDIYARHLRTTYRQALISPLEMLLASSSLTEFASRLAAMIRINRQDVQLASGIRAYFQKAGIGLAAPDDQVASPPER